MYSKNYINNGICNKNNIFNKLLKENTISLNNINRLINNVNKNNYNFNLDYLHKFIVNLNIKIKQNNFNHFKLTDINKFKRNRIIITNLLKKVLKKILKIYYKRIDNKKVKKLWYQKIKIKDEIIKLLQKVLNILLPYINNILGLEYNKQYNIKITVNNGINSTLLYYNNEVNPRQVYKRYNICINTELLYYINDLLKSIKDPSIKKTTIVNMFLILFIHSITQILYDIKFKKSNLIITESRLALSTIQFNNIYNINNIGLFGLYYITLFNKKNDIYQLIKNYIHHLYSINNSVNIFLNIDNVKLNKTYISYDVSNNKIKSSDYKMPILNNIKDAVNQKINTIKENNIVLDLSMNNIDKIQLDILKKRKLRREKWREMRLLKDKKGFTYI